MLHVYKIQAKFILDPNLNRTLPSVHICSVGRQGDQVASEKVLPPFAYIGGLSVTLDTGVKETYYDIKRNTVREY